MQAVIEITIPVLNEETTLAAQVRKVLQFIAKELNDLGSITLVIADNGSTDATQAIAQQLAAEHQNLTYLRLKERGVGRALKASWGASEATIVGYMDLDLATDLRYLRPALEKLCTDQADLVTGSRLAPGAQVIGRSAVRNLTSRGFNLIVKNVFRVSFSDGMCGFKFLQRKHLIELQHAGAISDGWFFATELLVAGEYLGYRVYDLPVEWTDDPNSKVNITKLTLEYLKAIQQLRRRLPKRKQ